MSYGLKNIYTKLTALPQLQSFLFLLVLHYLMDVHSQLANNSVLLLNTCNWSPGALRDFVSIKLLYQ